MVKSKYPGKMRPLLLAQEMDWARVDAIDRKYFLLQAGANPLSDSNIAEWSVRTYSAEEVQTTVKIIECANQLFLICGSVDFQTIYRRFGEPYCRHLRTIIIGSTALGRPWPSQANVASDLYPGHPSANFYNQVSLCLPLPINPTSVLYYQNGSALPPLHPPKKLLFPYRNTRCHKENLTGFVVTRVLTSRLTSHECRSAVNPVLVQSLLGPSPTYITSSNMNEGTIQHLKVSWIQLA